MNEPPRSPDKEPQAAANLMKILHELPLGSQARVLAAACAWCGFDGAIYALVRHATGKDDLPVAELPKPPPGFS